MHLLEVRNLQFGGRQSFKKARIVVAVEIKENGRRLGRIRIRHTLDLSALSLISSVMDHVEQGSIVDSICSSFRQASVL